MTATVRLADGRRVEIAVEERSIVITLERTALLRLTRREAWALAEALDAVATTGA